MINKNVNFECISISKHIINLFNDKLNVKCIRKLVKKSYTPVVPIANTCSIGYPHDSRADNAAYRHDRRADSLSRCSTFLSAPGETGLLAAALPKFFPGSAGL